MQNQIRQGDILLVEIAEDGYLKDKQFIGKDKKVLAYGEKTGNSHVLEGDVNFYDTGDGKILCQVNSKALLIHEEHLPKIEVPQGLFLAVRQREFDAVKGIRTVTD